MKRPQIFLILPLLLFLQLQNSCKDADLEKIRTGLQTTADAMATVQTTVITANQQGLLSTDDTRSILLVCKKIDQGGKQAALIAKAVSKLDDPTKLQLLGILNPVLDAVNESLTNGLLGIKNPQTYQKVQGALVTIQTTLTTIQSLLTISGGV
jgi:hypothetical protein